MTYFGWQLEFKPRYPDAHWSLGLGQQDAQLLLWCNWNGCFFFFFFLPCIWETSLDSVTKKTRCIHRETPNWALVSKQILFSDILLLFHPGSLCTKSLLTFMSFLISEKNRMDLSVQRGGGGTLLLTSLWYGIVSAWKWQGPAFGLGSQLYF